MLSSVSASAEPTPHVGAVKMATFVTRMELAKIGSAVSIGAHKLVDQVLPATQQAVVSHATSAGIGLYLSSERLHTAMANHFGRPRPLAALTSAVERAHAENPAYNITGLARVGGPSMKPLRKQAEIESFVLNYIAKKPELKAEMRESVKFNGHVLALPSTKKYWTEALRKLPEFAALKD